MKTAGATPPGLPPVLLGHTATATLVACQSCPELADLALTAFDTPEAWAGALQPPGTVAGLRQRPHLLLVPDATDTEAHAHRADSDFRTALSNHQVPFSALYPDGQGWLNAVLRACGLQPRPAHQTLRRWSCDACSDPDCEHRLFRDLLQARQADSRGH